MTPLHWWLGVLLLIAAVVGYALLPRDRVQRLVPPGADLLATSRRDSPLSAQAPPTPIREMTAEIQREVDDELARLIDAVLECEIQRSGGAR